MTCAPAHGRRGAALAWAIHVRPYPHPARRRVVARVVRRAHGVRHRRAAHPRHRGHRDRRPGRQGRRRSAHAVVGRRRSQRPTTVTPTLTNEPTQATIVQSGVRQRITIGSVEYTTDGSIARTCVVGGGECVDGIDEARISNLNITHTFWAERDGRASGSTAPRSVQQAVEQGRDDRRPARCVRRPHRAGP